MRRRSESAVLGLMLAAAACNTGGSQDAPKKGTNAAPVVEPVFSARPEATPADVPGASDDTRAHLNLQNLVHLADIDHEGLFIDFGTPARLKYTVGQWRTGWGSDGVEGETTYSNVASNTGRVYLPLAGGAGVTLRFRLKAVGTATMQLYVNNDALPIVRLDKSAGFTEYDVPVPAASVKPGENHVLMRFGGTTRVGSEDVSVAMDSLRVMPPAADGGGVAAPAAPEPAQAASTFVAPKYGDLVKDVVIDGQKRKALSVLAPTTLAYFVDVPKAAKLSMRAAAANGAPNVVVRITSNAGATEVLWKKTLSATWQEEVLSLEKWAGTVVKLELVAEGQGSVAFSSPSILVPENKIAEIKEPAKNVVVLLIDTMRADHLRAYDKSSRVQTPALDALAAEGTVFEAAQSPENWTKPSVASILTGLYPASHGAKESESKLSDKALMVSEVFKQNGFATGTFLANGYVSDKFGFKQGWDFYTNYIRENKSTTAQNVFKDAGDWVEKNKDKRFFLYVQTIDPHVPYDPPAEFLKMYDAQEYSGPIRPRDTPELLEQAKTSPPKVTFGERDRARLLALYDGEVTYHDRYLGTFIERLKKLGLYDNTMFVVVSDHGEEFYDHGSYGHGHTVYQELIHVPFIVRWPGAVPAGRRITESVGTVDVSPTVLTAAGIEVPEIMEGVDRMPHLRGTLPPGPAVAFSDFLDDRRVIRAGRWKLVLRGLNVTFFDLEKDPREKVELDPKSHPVAMRYCRILLGTFLGARDRGDWVSATQKGKSVELKGEAAEMDEATKAGLKALGYAN